MKIYYLRIALGIVAAFLCAGYGIATGLISNTVFSINTFMNSISIALVVYLISYYLIKRRFSLELEKEKQTKLVTMGVGIYFITWLVFWVLLYTLIAGPPVV
jgi:flagellar biosynthesis protein FliR